MKVGSVFYLLCSHLALSVLSENTENDYDHNLSYSLEDMDIGSEWAENKPELNYYYGRSAAYMPRYYAERPAVRYVQAAPAYRPIVRAVGYGGYGRGCYSRGLVRYSPGCRSRCYYGAPAGAYGVAIGGGYYASPG
ncbi:hypothetical protein AYI68_g6681, partial [Smittium mucronatum]